MCSTLGAPSWRTRIERTSHEQRLQITQNPIVLLLCRRHSKRRHGCYSALCGQRGRRYHGRMIVSCIVVIVLGVVEIVTAVFGIRAANNPAKAGVVWIWSIVCLACSVISLLLSLPSWWDRLKHPRFYRPDRQHYLLCTRQPRQERGHGPFELNRIRVNRSATLVYTPIKRADRVATRSALYVCLDKTHQNKPVPFLAGC